MTEVIISEKLEKKAAWFQVRPKLEIEPVDYKETVVEKKEKSFWRKIKDYVLGKINEGDEIVPVIPISEVKSRTILDIGRTNGIMLTQFRIY